MVLDKQGIEKIAKAIVDHQRGKFDIKTLEFKIISALGIPHPSVILKVNPKFSSKENMEKFKKAWGEAMNMKDVPFINADEMKMVATNESDEKKKIKAAIKKLEEE